MALGSVVQLGRLGLEDARIERGAAGKALSERFEDPGRPRSWPRAGTTLPRDGWYRCALRWPSRAAGLPRPIDQASGLDGLSDGGEVVAQRGSEQRPLERAERHGGALAGEAAQHEEHVGRCDGAQALRRGGCDHRLRPAPELAGRGQVKARWRPGEGLAFAKASAQRLDDLVPGERGRRDVAALAHRRPGCARRRRRTRGGHEVARVPHPRLARRRRWQSEAARPRPSPGGECRAWSVGTGGGPTQLRGRGAGRLRVGGTGTVGGRLRLGGCAGEVRALGHKRLAIAACTTANQRPGSRVCRASAIWRRAASSRSPGDMRGGWAAARRAHNPKGGSRCGRAEVAGDRGIRGEPHSYPEPDRAR